MNADDVVGLRLPEDLRAAIRACAEVERRQIAEVIESALWAYVRTGPGSDDWLAEETLALRTCTMCGQALMPRYIHIDPADHQPSIGPIRRP